MTFSDSRIVEALKRDWNPVWESVSPVKEVTFELGEGREVRGTVGGEIAIYFCDEKGQVFDILPALQSPAATLDAIQEALAFHKKQKGVMTRQNVRTYHLTEMRKVLDAQWDQFLAVDDLYSADEVTAGIELGFNLNPREEAAVEEMKRIEGKELFAEAAKNEAEREMKIAAGVDAATRDMREMTGSKVAFAQIFSEESITVVEPGGRGYYRWQVRRGFCGIDPSGSDENGWDAALKSPNEWKRTLFEHILRQPLGGGKFKYNSSSLEALSIIED